MWSYSMFHSNNLQAIHSSSNDNRQLKQRNTHNVALSLKKEDEFKTKNLSSPMTLFAKTCAMPINCIGGHNIFRH